MNTQRIHHDLLLLDKDEHGTVEPPGVLLCELMHRHRLRVREVAEVLDVSPSTVGRWRSDETPMPWASWLALHAALYRWAVAQDVMAERERQGSCGNLTK